MSKGEMGEVLGPAMPGPVRLSGIGVIEEWPGDTIEEESMEGFLTLDFE